jgi:AP-2 complex subunit beta-1
VKVFFCKYNDPIYVKLSKLEIIYRLADKSNVTQVLTELQEYASEVDVDFVRKAVRAIGRLAIKISSAADKCIAVLLELVSTKISYVVQEAVVVIKDVFRRYPNQYEGIIATLCEHLDALDSPEAKAAMIWIVGQYADRIDNSDELLEEFLQTFLEEPAEVCQGSIPSRHVPVGLIRGARVGPASFVNCHRQAVHQATNSRARSSSKGPQMGDRRG